MGSIEKDIEVLLVEEWKRNRKENESIKERRTQNAGEDDNRQLGMKEER